MSTPDCHSFIGSPFPALGLTVTPYPKNTPGFVPIAWRMISVGPGAMDIGSMGVGYCKDCRAKIWFSSDDESNILTFTERPWDDEHLQQMNAI